jgi:hypothetical protein
MNVPVPALPLFYSESTGRLWTSQIKVYYEGSDHPPRIRIENRTPLAGEVIYVHPRAPGSALLICLIHFLRRHMPDSIFPKMLLSASRYFYQY